MSAVMIVVGIFFIVGVAVGVITVVALSAIRRNRRRGDGPPEQGPGGSSRTGYWTDSHDRRAA